MTTTMTVPDAVRHDVIVGIAMQRDSLLRAAALLRLQQMDHEAAPQHSDDWFAEMNYLDPQPEIDSLAARYDALQALLDVLWGQEQSRRAELLEILDDHARYLKAARAEREAEAAGAIIDRGIA